MVERPPGEFRQGHALFARAAHHAGITAPSPQDRLPAPAGGGRPGTGHPQSRAATVRSACSGLAAAGDVVESIATSSEDPERGSWNAPRDQNACGRHKTLTVLSKTIRRTA